MYTYDFKIADTVIRLNHCHEITINPNFQPFQVFDEKPDCIVKFQPNSSLQFLYEKPLFSNISFEIQQIEYGFVKQYRDYKENNVLYAIGQVEIDGKSVNVEFLPAFLDAFSESQNSFSHIAIDELLMHRKKMILHAALIQTKFGGILFVGPARVGKSTQADLWHEYENAEIINGDRPIIGKKENVWYAWGSPYAGTSGYHIAKEIPISAIVVLDQAKENSVCDIYGKDAVLSVFPEITVNSWNPWYMNRVLDLLMSLIKDIPIYQLKCTPDIRAVNVLKEILMKEVV